MLQKAMDDPLAVAAAVEPTAEEQNEEGAGRARRSGSGGVFSVPRTAVVVEASGRAPSADGRRRGSGSSGGGGIIDRDGISRPKPALEGKALFALGLHRIEAAHEAAAVERDQTASRLSRLRLAVARRQREEDAAPGHAELLHYLLRFEELGRHSLERQEQLRRCRAERQTLALTRELLANQARLLETVAGGVEEASKGSKAAREAYLRQIKGIVEVGCDGFWALRWRVVLRLGSLLSCVCSWGGRVDVACVWASRMALALVLLVVPRSLGWCFDANDATVSGAYM